MKNVTVLESLIEEKVFLPIDLFFAKFCLEGSSSPDEEGCALFLAYLFASSRLGHHCVTVKEDGIFPKLDVFFNEKKDFSDLEEKIILGSQNLSKKIVQDNTKQLTIQPVVKSGNHFYLQKLFFLEKKLCQQLLLLKDDRALFEFPKEDVELVLSSFSSKLLPKQKQAVGTALQNTLTLITGGPGTGKTYTASYLIRSYLDLCKSSKPKIAVCAPTGKAAMHLKEKLSKVIDFEKHQIKTGTLHQLLNITKKSQDYYLDADLVLVDEASMLDIHLWCALTSAISKGSRLVLMGDPNQLPPIDSGTVFAELAKAAQQLPFKVIELEVGMRSKNQELVDLNQAVESQDYAAFEALLQSQKSKIAYHCLESKQQESLKLKTYNELLRSPLYKPFKTWDEKLLTYLNTMRLLSPFAKGPCGVETVNQELLSLHTQRASIGQKIAIPIMITKNDYEMQLFNGEVGVLIKTISHEKQGAFDDYVIFNKKDESGHFLKLPSVAIKSYSLAYCISVHKSQGSEYSDVTVFLPEGSEVFGVEMLYTAVSRAQEKISILAQLCTLKKCLRENSMKNSDLLSQLR